jgi:hypothetical protein
VTTLANLIQETAGSSTATATVDGLDVPMKKKKSKKQASDFAKEVSSVIIDNEQADQVFPTLRYYSLTLMYHRISTNRFLI